MPASPGEFALRYNLPRHMSLPPGTRLGPYSILAKLGEGGMGEVFSATDTRLKRQVAIKILPPALASDPDRLARFQREAEVLASLSHPHIAAIYGFEEADGTQGLVMELVEGPTLADRIAQGPIPVEEALPIARQIAEAIEAAHDQGIVHRDLKPANIKVRDDGAVKVLDFGLAKATERSPGQSVAAGHTAMTVDPARSPTMMSPAVSQVGVVVGTAAYMSPEQARGRSIDKRTDVWAYGAVLYEMLTGRRAFAGDDVTELIASVVKSTPDWSAIPPNVPAHVVALIQRCLDKDRRTRIGDIAVARFVLSSDATALFHTTAEAESIKTARWRSTVPWVAAALIAGALAGWLIPRRQDSGPPVTHVQMGVQPAAHLTPSVSLRPSRPAFALSPDGRSIVFAGMRDAGRQLYLRTLDRVDATAIAGTEGGIAPFFSPDGNWIAFVADNTIKKVPTAGGPASTICAVPAPFWGASWADDDTIFFAARRGIFRVPSSGGTATAVTTVDIVRGDRHLLPYALPGSRSILFTSPPNIVHLSLDTGEQRTIVEDAADARYIRSGHLVFMKTGTLMAARFDAESGRLTGSPVAVIENVMQGVNAGNSSDETLAGQFSFSDSGSLAYAVGGIFPSRKATLVWVDRKGAAQPVEGIDPRPFLFPRLSPDGQKIAVAIRADTSRATDLWVYDVARASPTRLTFDGGGTPAWSPDGKRIAYQSRGLHVINADGSGKPERLPDDAAGNPASWSRAANAIVFLRRPTLESYGIWTLSMAAPNAQKPELFLESRYPLTYPEVSPDGRWIAYSSTESGEVEVYVQSYPRPGEKTRISTASGFEPIWNPNGGELLYRAQTQTGGLEFLSVAIRSTSPFRVDPPRRLFDAKPGEYDQTSPMRSWDITADGQRFLMLRNAETADKLVTTINVALNWVEELTRRVPR